MALASDIQRTNGPKGYADQRPKLKRELGLGMATALVIGNMIGSGVFLLPAALAGVALVSGSSSLLAWALTGAGAMLLAGVFATLGRAYPRTGGPYVYARRAFGEFIGFQTAWGYWIAAWVGNAAIATAFVGYLTVFYPSLGTNHLAAALVAIGAIWFLTFVNALGVRQGGMVQVATTVLKFVPLALIGIIGLFFMHASHFTPFAPAGLGTGNGMLGGITAAMALTLWAFIGLESATVPAEEVKDPQRNIPRATIYGTLVTTLVYILATVAVMGVIPPGRTGPVERSVRRGRSDDLRRVVGQDRRPRGDDLHLRRLERMDLAHRAGVARGRRGRRLPEAVREGAG